MAFILKVCRGEDNLELINDPSPEMIDLAMNEIIPARFHFVILESKPHTNNCVCIQTIIKLDDRPQINFMVEAHFKHGEKFAYYRCYTSDIDWLKRVFRMFALEEVPNTENWVDVTDEVIASINKSKEI